MLVCNLELINVEKSSFIYNITSADVLVKNLYDLLYFVFENEPNSIIFFI